jgi:phage terminase Nu1 subunit (DNA packaging protein)
LKQRQKAKVRRDLVTRAAAALALGVAPNRINKWVGDGAPVAVPGKRGHSAMYDLEALQAWREARQPEAGDALSLGAARARLAEAQAVKWERENLVRMGQLIERGEAVREGQAVIAALKARLLSLPRQAVLRGALQREHEPVLRGLVVEALRELARWKTVEDAETAERRRPA